MALPLICNVPKLLFILLIACWCFPATAQTVVDTTTNTTIVADSLVKEPMPTERNPKRAALMSAIVPGLGQAYNKKYWKLPIVYAALGTAGYLVVNNRLQYLEFRNAYILDTNVADGEVSKYYDLGYQLSDLQRIAEQYRTWTEFSAIGFLAVYLLQVVDATVDAHLYYFDVSEDLTMHWQPTILPGTFASQRAGLSLTLTF